MAILFALPPGVAAAATPTDFGAPMYHNGATLVCSDCHTMHFSQSHKFVGAAEVSATPAPGGDWLPGTGPNKSLLKAPSATDLCLACHDGRTFAPDVVDIDQNGLTERAAGHFAAQNNPNFRGHNLSNSLVSDPNTLCDRCHFVGSMATASVTCTDCHAKHGNGSYRNLQWASWPGGEPTIVALIRPGAAGMGRYEKANVAYAAPQAYSGWREATNICTDCHHAFMSDSSGRYTGSSSPYKRHPGTNTEWGYNQPINKSGAHTDPAYWVAGAGDGFRTPRLPFLVAGATDFASATVVAANNEAFCLSCHKAHGTANAFGLRWAYGGPQNGHNTDGCIQCHNNVLN
jgi:predicted CXXCH cytochrome family protein